MVSVEAQKSDTFLVELGVDHQRKEKQHEADAANFFEQRVFVMPLDEAFLFPVESHVFVELLLSGFFACLDEFIRFFLCGF